MKIKYTTKTGKTAYAEAPITAAEYISARERVIERGEDAKAVLPNINPIVRNIIFRR